MKRVLLDYSMLSTLANPGTSKTEKAKNPFFAYMNRESGLQAVCFDFQLQAINITSYKRKAIEEEMTLKGFEHMVRSEEGILNEGEENMILQRQESVVERLNKKSDRISNLFSNGLANSISTSFMLPGSVISMYCTHFIDESDLKQYNIEVIPLNKAELMRILIYINQWKEKNDGFKISDLTLLDLITRMLCGFLHIEEWLLLDSENRMAELNTVFCNAEFQETLQNCEFYPTLIR
ncbi:MAG: hypothetical protein IPP64_11700 [Bacteroidetes bacterium]|nr:hypothetical protein [Bacteroidota bacterium]